MGYPKSKTVEGRLAYNENIPQLRLEREPIDKDINLEHLLSHYDGREVKLSIDVVDNPETGYSPQKRLQVYFWVLDRIRDIGCYVDYRQLYGFMLNDDAMAQEYRLGGKFGFGFKLYRNGNVFQFGQYSEDATAESQNWIKEANEILANK